MTTKKKRQFLNSSRTLVSCRIVHSFVEFMAEEKEFNKRMSERSSQGRRCGIPQARSVVRAFQRFCPCRVCLLYRHSLTVWNEPGQSNRDEGLFKTAITVFRAD